MSNYWYHTSINKYKKFSITEGADVKGRELCKDNIFGIYSSNIPTLPS